MEYYIESMKAAASKCHPRELKDIFDYYMGLTIEDYHAGALDVIEYSYIIDCYNDILMAKNTFVYLH